ncbi:ATP-binding protein [Reichenbachiella sp.]|uniref:AAA family ATPase n=1 Tax=Reichenbachiella sp. TaxID=2184521 RepID=UPI003299945C
MRKPSNPFLVSGYHSPVYFCDRKQELDWLMDQFSNERNAVITAWRRLGKTALIRHFFHLIEKEKQGETIYIDILGTANLSEAHQRIASAVTRKYGDIKKGASPAWLKLISAIGANFSIDPLTGLPEVSVGMMPAKSVQASLEAIGVFLSDRGKPVVICIDEFQQIVNYPEDHAEAIFRSWAQEYPMVRFVYSGSHRHMMESMFSEQSRPFYRSAQILHLEALPKDTYGKFIRRQFKKSGQTIGQTELDLIFDWTRMQTYYMQLICNYLFGQGTITADKVREVCTQIIQQEVPIYSSYQQLMTSFQWKLLVAIAKNGTVVNPLAKDFISAYQLGAASSVSSALKMLEKKEFVIKTNEGLVIHDTLLMRWLQAL